MINKSINHIIKEAIFQKNTNLIIGPDVNYEINPLNSKKKISFFKYLKIIIENTYDLVIGYKVNVSFFECFGYKGLQYIRKINRLIKKIDKKLIIIADAKISEINQGVFNLKKKFFYYLDFDYIGISPWFGSDTIKPFLNDINKGICVYVHDSNKSASEIQDLTLKNNQKLYEFIAFLIKKIDVNDNIIYEAGLTYPEQLRKIRKIIGNEKLILTTGAGAQGGKIEDLKGLFGKKNNNLLVSISRGIIYPEEIKNFELSQIDNISKIIRKKAIFYKDKINKLKNNE